MEEKRLSLLIDIAIEREEEAAKFYRDLAKKVQDKSVQDTLEFLAKEEDRHKQFLSAYRAGNYEGSLDLEEVVDYKIAEHMEEPDADEMKNSTDAYLIAAHKELQSYRFYKSMADLHTEGKAKEMLYKSANEEMKHKERVEYLYSNSAFPPTSGG